MDSSYTNGRYSGAKAPRINEPNGNGHTNGREPRSRMNRMLSKDSLSDYVFYGPADGANGTIYDAPSPSISTRKDWSEYQPTCEEVTDEDEPPKSTPRAPPKEPVREKQNPTRRQSTREPPTPQAKASTPAERRKSVSFSPEVSRKPSPAIDPFPKSVAWETQIRPDKVRSNAYNILPSCRHWEGMSNFQGCHSAPVLGWDRGHFHHDSSVLDLSTCAQVLPSRKYVLPDDSYFNSNDASDSNGSSDGNELISGWWVLGHSTVTDKLRACTSCMRGLMAIVPEQLIRFVPMEPHETKNHKCHFSSLLVRFGWFLMLHKLKRWGAGKDRRRLDNDRWYMIVHTLTLLGRAVSNAPSACPNDNLQVGDWYSFPVNFSKTNQKLRYRLDCLICPQDYQLIISLFPWTLRFLNRVPTDEVLMQPHLCSLRMDTIRWNDLVYTLCVGSAGYDGTTPIKSQTRRGEMDFYPGGNTLPWVLRDVTELPSLLTKRIPYDRCPRDNDLVRFTWFYIPELPQFTVCHHCYATVVLPLRRTGSKIAQAFGPRPEYPIQEAIYTPRLAPPSATSSPRSSPRHSRSSSSQSGISPISGYDTGTFCKLYSTRMRDIFNYVAATDPVPVSVGKAKDLNEQWQEKQLNWKKAVRSPALLRAQPVGASPGGSSGSRTPEDYDKHAVAFPLVNFRTFEDAFEYLKARVLARDKVLKGRVAADKALTLVEKNRRAPQEDLDAAREEYEYWDGKWEVLE